MTTTGLAEALKELGQPVPASGITRVEKGDRRVDVDDLIALSIALNVSPLTLLLPPSAGDDPVKLTESLSISSRNAWAWAEGHRPATDWEPGEGVNLAGPGADPAIAVGAYEREQEYARRHADYVALARPESRRRAEGQPAVRLARQLESLVADIVAPEPGVDRAAIAARVRMARRRHAQLGLDLEEIIEHLPPEPVRAESAEE